MAAATSGIIGALAGILAGILIPAPKQHFDPTEEIGELKTELAAMHGELTAPRKCASDRRGPGCSRATWEGRGRGAGRPAPSSRQSKRILSNFTVTTPLSTVARTVSWPQTLVPSLPIAWTVSVLVPESWPGLNLSVLWNVARPV